MINRLRKSVEDQESLIADFAEEKADYLKRIDLLEGQLKNTGEITDELLKATQKNSNDDLKAINGIGQMTEETLNDFGIYSFRQLAEISKDNMELLSQVISSTPQKIGKWAKDAKKLMEKEKVDS